MRPTYPEFNVVVATPPRSYSSSMVLILDALGVNMVYSTEDPVATLRRELDMRKRHGSHFVMNDNFGEIGREDWDRCEKEILETPYSGFKAILPAALGGKQWGLITVQPTKAILMWRDPEEIYESQRACYIRPRVAAPVAEDPEDDRARKIAAIASYMAQAKLAFMKRQEQSGRVRFRGEKAEKRVAPFDFMTLSVDDLRREPIETIAKLAAFIESPIPIWNAVEVFDPAKVRFRHDDKPRLWYMSPKQDPRDMRQMVTVQLPDDADIDPDEDEGEYRQGRETVMHLLTAKVNRVEIEKAKAKAEDRIAEIEKALADLHEKNGRRKKKRDEITVKANDGDEITMHFSIAMEQVEAYQVNVESLAARISALSAAIDKVEES